MTFFGSNSNLNANSVQDAFQQIVKLASVLQENLPSNATLSDPMMSDNDRDELVTQALMTQDGKVSLAQAMANPIRRNLDYQGIARRTLVIDPLPQGALPVYDRDIDVAAMVISSNGTAPESRIYSERITVPELEIVSNPTARMLEVRRRRFNMIDRAVQKARQEIMAQEDANIFLAIDSAAQIENDPLVATANGIVKNDLLQIKRSIDRWDLVTAKYFMNINEFTDILGWGSGGGQGTNGGDLDPVTMREVLQTGLYAHIWGADIMVSKIVPAGTLYGVADPEFLGVMPIRQDIEVLPADEPKRLMMGWVVNEVIGIGIVNPRAACVSRKAS